MKLCMPGSLNPNHSPPHHTLILCNNTGSQELVLCQRIWFPLRFEYEIRS
jgi:hypothetical protein